jgi:hypothetical protein
MIVETFDLTASDTDVLAAPSRLASIPYTGTLIIELQANANDGTNYWQVTIQLPNGDVPAERINVPAGASTGGMNSDDKYRLTIPVTTGGHVLVDALLTGATGLFVRATLMP